MSNKYIVSTPSERMYNGNVYQSAPTMPSLEININQHNPTPVSSPYQVSTLPPVQPSPPAKRNPPLSAPPPPPLQAPMPIAPPRSQMYGSTYNYPMDSDSGGLIFDKWPKRENRGMFRLCLIEFLLAAFVLAGGIWCARENAMYCPYYSAIWTGSIFLLNALIGGIASRLATHNLYLAHLLFSVISVILCIIGCILSFLNYNWIGTYKHAKVGPYDSFCVLGRQDAHHISYIYSHMDQYNFEDCLWSLKAGIASNSVQFVITAVLALLNAVSIFFCLKRSCRRH